jgi:hypothetical protein
MMEVLKLDLHIHSTVSDGTDTPAEILERVKGLGLTHFALTDHDAIKGCAAIKDLLQEGDPTFIYGAEFSCEDAFGKYHILGYGYDLAATSIQNLVHTCHQYRINKVQRRLDWLLSECKISFPEEALVSLFALSNPGKPHIANMMLQYGYADSKAEAFNLLNRFKEKEKRIPPEVAIEAILGANGIPILAHPSYGSGAELIVGEEMERRITRLMGCGLKGIEAFYSGFSQTLQNELLSLADRYALYLTAGSDYHGTNKLVLLGDTNLDTITDYPAGLRRFLTDVINSNQQ